MNNVKKKVILIGGARPNFMKIAPLWKEMCRQRNYFHPILLHTGQHYDYKMSAVFFKDLELPEPDIYLGVGSGSHAEQTAKVMVEFEKICLSQKLHLIIVVGDVNSTLACSIVAAKLLIPLAHVESGLRSFDRQMPEEINRIVTDSVSDYLFTTCRDADKNLLREGVNKEKIFFTGNVMIDTLNVFTKKAESLKVFKKMGLDCNKYALLTLHRPSNVDDKKSLEKILKALKIISKDIPIIFPVHPRTKKRIEELNLKKYFSNSYLKMIDPLGYLEFMNLVMNSKFVLTDSGGIQEETTVLRIPCITLRKNTERPITVTVGTNTIVGDDTNKILKEAGRIINGKYKKGRIPELWDGKAAVRIVQILRNINLR